MTQRPLSGMWFLSEAHLQLKRIVCWFVLVMSIGYCGVMQSTVSEGLFAYLQAPEAHEGAPLSLSFVPYGGYEKGAGHLLRTYAGWIPLENATSVSVDGPRSVRGIWHSDGTLTAVEVWEHPYRRAKVGFSAGAALLISALFYLRYRRGWQL